MTQAVEKVLCKACGANVPEDRVDGDGICEGCPGAFASVHFTPPDAVGAVCRACMCDVERCRCGMFNGAPPAPELQDETSPNDKEIQDLLRGVDEGLALAQRTAEEINATLAAFNRDTLSPPTLPGILPPSTEEAENLWSLTHGVAADMERAWAEQEAARLEREEERRFFERVNLNRAKSKLERDLRGYWKSRVTWEGMLRVRSWPLVGRTQYLEAKLRGMRDNDLAEIHGLTAALRLVRDRLRALEAG